MKKLQKVYLDYQATTPLDPRVLKFMLPYFNERFGNPHSRNHSYGWEAEESIEVAREQVANIIGANPKEIVFTSGATESNNIAIIGSARYRENSGRHLITMTTEHKAVSAPFDHLESEGFEITRLSPESTLPTPEGVPVNIKSPIFNVKYLETYDIR